MSVAQQRRGIASLFLVAALFAGIYAHSTSAASVDSNTVLLIHADGADGTTGFGDAALQATTTVSGDAQVDTAQSKFGGASALFSSGSISIPDSSNLTFTGDFTVDMWIRASAFTGDNTFVAHAYSVGGGYRFKYASGNGLTFQVGAGCTVTQGATAGWSTGTWYHVAAVRSGTTVNVYRDGTSLASGTCSGTIDGNGTLTIALDNGSDPHEGWVDEVRISNGVARWTSNFTPPTAAYTGGVDLTSGGLVTGNVSVLGTISKGAGTFVIDHPLDPKNKLLYHSFVESPEVKNVYDGIATLDEHGEATIRLPKYFIPLNRDYRYLVTPVSEPMPDLHLKRGVRREWFFGAPSFRVAGGKPGGEISWQVTGVRKDPFILANPIIPEVEKGSGQLVEKGECIFEPLCK